MNCKTSWAELPSQELIISHVHIPSSALFYWQWHLADILLRKKNQWLRLISGHCFPFAWLPLNFRIFSLTKTYPIPVSNARLSISKFYLEWNKFKCDLANFRNREVSKNTELKNLKTSAYAYPFCKVLFLKFNIFVFGHIFWNGLPDQSFQLIKLLGKNKNKFTVELSK